MKTLSPIALGKRLTMPIHAPYSFWPLWAKALAKLAKPSDRGLGDVVERVVGPIGGNAYKAWHLKTFGVPCDCLNRQYDLNERFPLELKRHD